MKQLIALIAQAVAVLAGYRTRIKELQDENQTLRDELAKQGPALEDLKAKLAAEELDDAALEEAKAAAEKTAADAQARADALQADVDAANAEGEKLAAALTENPDAPSVDENFNPVDSGTSPA